MNRSVSKSLCALALLVMVGACKSGPPSISELKMTKTKEAAEAATTFDAKDTLYAVANIANPPKDGKVVGRLVVVNVEGQQPGPIPSLETTLDLAGGMNTANFNFTPPPAGWPNGTYALEVSLGDASGEKDKKSVQFTTAGNAPAAPAAAATDTTATTDSTATATESTDTAGEEKPQQ